MPDTTSRNQRPQILLLGKNGQLGWELQRTLQPLGMVHALDYPEIDLTRPDTLDGLLQKIHPEIIVNATAYTAVDEAESKPDVCMSINAQAPGIIGIVSITNKSAGFDPIFPRHITIQPPAPSSNPKLSRMIYE